MEISKGYMAKTRRNDQYEDRPKESEAPIHKKRREFHKIRQQIVQLKLKDDEFEEEFEIEQFEPIRRKR